jgi:hypothetical protein
MHILGRAAYVSHDEARRLLGISCDAGPYSIILAQPRRACQLRSPRAAIVARARACCACPSVAASVLVVEGASVREKETDPQIGGELALTGGSGMG